MSSDLQICLYIESSRHNVQLDYSILQLSKFENCSFFGSSFPLVIRALRKFMRTIDEGGLRAAIVLGSSAVPETWHSAQELITNAEFGEVIFSVALAQDIQALNLDQLPTMKGQGSQLGFVVPVSQAICASPQNVEFNSIFSAEPPIFGRDEELKELTEKFGNSRQVSIIGMGGVGKTRFVLEFAKQREIHALDGVVYCDLSDAHNLEFAKKCIAEKLERVDDITAADAEYLFIADNLNAEVKDRAQFATQLLELLPKSQIIFVTTSPLGLPNECIFRLEPFRSNQSVQRDIFLDNLNRQGRSLVIGESDSLVDEVCRQCHGVPLAIVRAAVLARSMPMGRLCERIHNELLGANLESSPLRQSFARQFKALSESDLRNLERLSVIGSRFSLKLVGYLLGDEVSAEGKANEFVSRLIDANIISLVGGRLEINELIRKEMLGRVKKAGRCEFYQEQLAKVADQVIQDFQFYSNRIDQAEAFRRLELDFDALQNAFEWRVSKKDRFVEAAEMALSVMLYFVYRGYYSKPLEEFLKLLEKSGEFKDKALEMRIKQGTGRLMRAVGHYSAAIQLFKDARDIAVASNDLNSREMALRNLAICELNIGQYENADAHFQEAILLQRQGGKSHGLALTLNEYAGLMIRQGQKTRGAELIFESMEIWNQLNLDWGKAWTLVELSWLSLLNNDVPMADHFIEQAHEISKKMKHASLKANVLLVKSRIRAEEFQYGLAEKHAKRSLIISRRTDEFMDLLLALRQLTQIYVLRENYAALDSVMGEMCTIHARTGSKDYYVWPAYVGAVRAMSKGHFEVALALLGFASQRVQLYRNGMDFTIEEDDPKFKVCRARLGEERSRALISGGRNIPADVLIKALPLDPTVLLKYVDGLIDIPAPPTVKFSMREMEVLLAMSLAKSNQEIADQLIISVGTVKRHVFNIMQKLEAKNRVDVLQKARTAGLF